MCHQRELCDDNHFWGVFFFPTARWVVLLLHRLPFSWLSSLWWKTMKTAYNDMGLPWAHSCRASNPSSIGLFLLVLRLSSDSWGSMWWDKRAQCMVAMYGSQRTMRETGWGRDPNNPFKKTSQQLNILLPSLTSKKNHISIASVSEDQDYNIYCLWDFFLNCCIHRDVLRCHRAKTSRNHQLLTLTS